MQVVIGVINQIIMTITDWRHPRNRILALCKRYLFFIASVSGPHEKMENCGTCSLTDMKCPGHLGHIELPVPVYHPLWMRQLELVSIICN